MIDTGRWLEPAAEARRRELEGKEPSDFAPQAVEAYCRPQRGAPPGEILRFGSGFFFDGAESLQAGDWSWLGLRASFAKGGLSNTWGGAVLPWRQEDIADWPLNADELAPHYRAVASVMPISGKSDALQSLFPVQDATVLQPLSMSPQARKLLQRLDRHRPRLEQLGVHHGAARQAVSGDCRLCGLCLYGCPYRYIYTSASTVEELSRRPNFSYRPGRTAVRFAEDDGGVRLTCRVEGAHEFEDVAGERLFIAAGVLPSARLVLSSIPGLSDEVVLLDCQQFFTPMLHWWPLAENPATTAHHTLAEFFIEISDGSISPFLVHTQLYTYNDLYAHEMKVRYGTRLPFSERVYEALSRRLIVAQTFLHSDHSPKLGLQAVRRGDEVAFMPRHIPNPETGRIVGAARKRLANALRRAGLFAVIPASRLGTPGSSFHVGGSFPMSKTPRGPQTDLIGRPAGLRRVHLVDASVLPSIPATTITFSVMANAHRIAAQAP